jgi:RNA polymerase sigma factor (sigma-70 family)
MRARSKNRRKNEKTILHPGSLLPGSPITPHDHMETTELLRQQLSAAIAGLPEKQRLVYTMQQEGATYQEIATCLNIKESTVSNHIQQAKENIRKALSQIW